ncbi:MULTISPECIES: peptidoglycan-binding protein [Nostoc]|uniref:Peptidoglycan-binding protein n=2 Tax=Nostoc TaxID=1177 RepID=A0ABR8I4T0_9NOSO|nr:MULTISPECIES: peptidoglycan-binding protein [Nostoc]MBD2561149.1 peptidoglycan-binding protein [Nostoc linckia FACHB-391]MBD2645912.1 peptidoglycan-binding protein [Nostoc foliaceum FACHB-393]
MYKKSTGWIPDYPDFRDYRMDEINQKLMITVQDIQINNDNDSQNSIEELFELLKLIKNGLNPTLEETLASKFNNFQQKINKGFKLVNAKALKEQIFLAHGCAGQEVYNLQQKLLEFSEYEHIFGTEGQKIRKFVDDFSKSDYLEYGYFGEITKEAVKLFKSIFGLSIVSDDSIDRANTDDKVDSVVDQVTLYTLDRVLEILKLQKTEETSKAKSTEKTIKKFGMFDPEIKDIQIKLNKLGYLKNLGENNGAIKGFFDYLTEDAVQEFQRQYHPSKVARVDGIVDEKTKRILDDLYDAQAKQYSGDDKLKKVQQLLCELGEFDGQVTGYSSRQTDTAIKSFQARYEIEIERDDVDCTKTLQVLSDLVALKKQQQREVLPASSTIPITLYEIILRVFEISELKPEHFVNEKIIPKATDSINSDLAKHRDALKRAIDMIVKLVAQLISPLAKHRNLEKAVRDVLDKLDQWFDKSEYVNYIRQENNQQGNNKSGINAKNNKYSQQKLWEKSSIFSQAEQEKNLFKDWDLNPVSLYIAISAILNFKQSLSNIDKKITDQVCLDKDRKKKLATSLKKIDDIFKSIKDLEVTIKNLKISLNYNPQVQGENNSKTQPNNLRTVIQILPERQDYPKHLEKSLEFQSDLQLPLEGHLQKCVKQKQKQENSKNVTVYLLMPEFVDLTFWCSPIEDQGSLDSCTAHAGVALMEYFEKRSFDRYVDASRLFLYKATLNLMHRHDDAGASLRETMRAMALFGVPPEEYWPYQEDRFKDEPTPFCYSFGQSYQALKYFRLNPLGTTGNILLFRIKTALAAGFPCAFGFTMYYSIEDLNPSGYIPYPVKNDKVKGGHAVVAVGYDDHKVIENADGSRCSQGALLIRNCWGTHWGEGGYGWLPYDYVLEGLTNDWWSLLKSKWFETGHFGLEANDWVSNLGGGPTDNTPKENSKPPRN